MKPHKKVAAFLALPHKTVHNLTAKFLLYKHKRDQLQEMKIS